MITTRHNYPEATKTIILVLQTLSEGIMAG
jgi:hypothetical protein